MNNTKPQRLVLQSVLVTESVFRAVVEIGSEIQTKRLYFTQNSELCLFLCKRTQKVITELGIYRYIYVYIHVCIYIYIFVLLL